MRNDVRSLDLPAAVIAPYSRQQSTGRRAVWVVRLDAADCAAAEATSRCQALGTGASRISEPLAADW